MTVHDKLMAARVRFVVRDDSRLMRFVGWLVGDWFMDSFVTTLRFPFCRPIIYYPSGYPGPRFIPMWLLEHELHHVWQFAPWYGPWLMALLFCYPGGRWRIERRAWLVDIRRERIGISAAARLFRIRYRWPFPVSWMPDTGKMLRYWALHEDDDPAPW